MTDSDVKTLKFQTWPKPEATKTDPVWQAGP